MYHLYIIAHKRIVIMASDRSYIDAWFVSRGIDPTNCTYMRSHDTIDHFSCVHTVFDADYELKQLKTLMGNTVHWSELLANYPALQMLP